MGYLDELKLQRNTKMLKMIQDLRTITLKETRTESSSPFQKNPQLLIVLQQCSIVISRKRESQSMKFL